MKVVQIIRMNAYYDYIAWLNDVIDLYNREELQGIKKIVK